MSETLATIIIAIVTAPILTYLCVKLGTIAFYNGKRFYHNHQNERDEDGQK